MIALCTKSRILDDDLIAKKMKKMMTLVLICIDNEHDDSDETTALLLSITHMLFTNTHPEDALVLKVQIKMHTPMKTDSLWHSATPLLVSIVIPLHPQTKTRSLTMGSKIMCVQKGRLAQKVHVRMESDKSRARQQQILNSSRKKATTAYMEGANYKVLGFQRSCPCAMGNSTARVP
eukprot:5259262-Amphidinium_carterae.1